MPVISIPNPLMHPDSKSPPELITFHYKSHHVFVKPDTDFQKMIDVALEEYREFPELSQVPKRRIGFFIPDGRAKERRIRISESAWPVFVSNIPRGTMIDLYIRSDPDKGTPPPPDYSDMPKIVVTDSELARLIPPALPRNSRVLYPNSSAPPIRRSRSAADVAARTRSQRPGSRLPTLKPSRWSWFGGSDSR